ncbi:uncharacterized protein BDZ99DRAFT_468712 [Mytilinidion resinicola]|uniref:Uncharacterized protein n=1 Tax=Mytilinidion resinicola TaxID=574789 RepID=A0A6A6Y2K0_9PEZI|nr:uncharacterized protein BDZ99DRAFT_468712 [Mytilinidion resinicola]KAF2802743.1 hypothetical protein BDZ99DRAFT_468712 [Mytilinidion resinicola]
MDWNWTLSSDQASFRGTRNWFANFAEAMGTEHRLKSLRIDCKQRDPSIDEPWLYEETGPIFEHSDIPFFLEPLIGLNGISLVTVDVPTKQHEGGISSSFAAQLRAILKSPSKTEMQQIPYVENARVKRTADGGIKVLSVETTKEFWEPEFKWAMDDVLEENMREYARIHAERALGRDWRLLNRVGYQTEADIDKYDDVSAEEIHMAIVARGL